MLKVAKSSLAILVKPVTLQVKTYLGNDLKEKLTLPMLKLLSFKVKNAKIYEKYPNPVKLVFIG